MEFSDILYISFRMHEVKIQNLALLDVDGSYLYRKYQDSQAVVRVALLPPPSTPLFDWHNISDANVTSISAHILCLFRCQISIKNTYIMISALV